MSISYFKNIPVVFLVQEGDELPRTATEEDFLRAGYVPAANRGKDAATELPESTPVTPETEVVPEQENKSKFYDSLRINIPPKDEDCPLTCEDCLFLGEDHFLVELATLPEVIVDTLSDVFDNVKSFRLDDLKGHVDGLLDPFKFVESEDKATSKEKTSPVEDFAGDLFTGAFSIFDTVKNGLSGLLDSVDSPEPAKSSGEDTTAKRFKDAPFVGIFEDELKRFESDLAAQFPHLVPEWENENATSETPTTEPKKEEVPVEEKPEFNEFEQTVINKFDEMGLGADARAAMRKSKEFSEFLSSNKPTAEQAKAFADLLKNGKPPFFGG